MTNLVPKLKHLLIEHIEELDRLRILPDDWRWHPEILKDGRKVNKSLIKDIKKLHRLGIIDNNIRRKIEKELERLKILLVQMYNSNNLGRGMSEREKNLMADLISHLDPELRLIIKKSEQASLMDVQIYNEMLVNMEREIQLLNSDGEVIRNGFSYPVELYNKFKRGILSCIEQGVKPDIGIVGYGSLQAPASRKWTFGSEVKVEYVIVKNILRGAFFASINRFKPNITQIGFNKNLSCMGVRYFRGAWFNGVRMSNLSHDELSKLHDREFYYFLLPCGKAETMDSRVYDFNLICWPIGQTLLRKVREWRDWYKRTTGALAPKTQLKKMVFATIDNKTRSELLKTAFERAKKAMGNLSDKQLNTNPQLLQKVRKKADVEMRNIIERRELDIQENSDLSKALQRTYLKLVNNFTSMDNRFEPNLNYMYTCMQIGDADQERLFLKSTWCFDPNGKLILFADYLRIYGKSNEKLRFSFSPKSGRT